jgi:aryl-alcohol dehydrogenase-like predicted oxidoreductase
MQSASLGKSGLTVSRMGLGLAALGRPGYINLGHASDLARDYDVSSMRERAHGVLDEAWRRGVRYFDAARSYGRAEEFLATWLEERRIAPADVTVGSKWGYTYTAGWQVRARHHEVKDHSRATLLRQWNESHARLGEQLDLYQIHSATLESGVLDDRDVLAELARLRRGGVRIGLTLSGPRQADTLRRALEVEIDGEDVFDSVQATWNLLERSAEPALRAAHAAGWGVIVKEALANGRLTARNRDPDFRSKLAHLETVASAQGVGADAIALAAALAQPWADVVLSGAATVEHLRSNLRAADVRWNDEMVAGLAPLSEAAGQYWSIRSRLAWN